MPTTDLRKFDLQIRSETYQYRTPMKFGGRVVNDVTVLSVDSEGESGAGTARGLGSMTMGVAWAWPDAAVDGDTKLNVVVELAQRLADSFQTADQTGHPMDICHRHNDQRGQIAADLASEKGLVSGIPELAVLLAASPIEAAIFDLHGKAAAVSSYELLSRDHLVNDLSHYLGDDYRGIYLDQLIDSRPVDSMPLYHLVGALDPLTPQDVAQSSDGPVGDGLPETLGDWIDRNGLTHLKIKLNGDDLDWDVDRVIKIHEVASGRRPGEWYFSLDFNERCDDEDYVLSLLEKVKSLSHDALKCVQYIEQPTHRDLESHPELTMHRVAAQLPVVIDESLIDLQSLRTAVAQGYSGIALKACKGQAEALLLGAVARHEKLFLCVQDLTCVGASLLHSASLAAHIPGVAAIESNGRQYAPEGNERWTQFNEFFEVRDGKVPTSQLTGPGLGYGDDPALA